MRLTRSRRLPGHTWRHGAWLDSGPAKFGERWWCWSPLHGLTVMRYDDVHPRLERRPLWRWLLWR